MHFDTLYLNFSRRVRERSAKTRASIKRQARWIAGSSRAMTPRKSIIAPFATPL
jgi:hypothetical protein